MKRALPTLRGPARPRRAQRERSLAGGERPALAHKVLAVAQIDQVAQAARLSTQVCAAFVAEGVEVGALVSADHPGRAADAQKALSALLQAGASKATLVREPDRDALAQAVERMAGSGWVIALGNALPQLFTPAFTVVVTGHRRSLTDVSPIVLQANLEVTSPSDELATLLVRRLLASSDEREPPDSHAH